MTATLIPRALNSGARLLARCKVERLVAQRGRVVRVIGTTRNGGSARRVRISPGSVFVCAGTIETAALLQRSRISNGSGRRFQLHPTVRLLARFPEPVNAHRHRLPLAAITECMPDLRFGGSIFMLPAYGMALAEDWARRSEWLHDYAHHVIYYAMIRPDGVGRVFTMPSMGSPIVTYRLTERDWRRLGNGVMALANALFTAGAQRVVPSVRGHPGWSDPAELASSAFPILPPARTALMSIHLFGSCPMGEEPGTFAVDSYGRLRGIDNVMIADGSILPGAPGVNPQATIMALAFRVADLFLAGSRRLA